MSEILASLGFDWRMALANLINFIIILIVLKKFAFEPIKKTIEERQKKIEQGLEDARKSATELQMAETTRDKTLMNARVESGKIIAKATENAERILADAQRIADSKEAEIMVKARKVIEAEKERMIVEVREEVVRTTIKATEKLIGKTLDKNADKKLVEDLLK